MNEHGRKRATFVAATALVYASFLTTAAFGDEPQQSRSLPPVTAQISSYDDPGAQTASSARSAVDAASAAPASSSGRPQHYVTLFTGGVATSYLTSAATVGEFLGEHAIVPALQDAVSIPLAKGLRTGMNVAFRRAVDVTVVDGAKRSQIRSSAEFVRQMLATNGYILGSGDDVTPSGASRVVAGETVHIDRVSTWTTHVTQSVPMPVRTVYDRTLASGIIRTENPGRTGLRELSYRYERRNEIARRVSIVSRIVRAPQDRVIVHGIGRLAALEHIAKTGFDATVNFAGQAISMIATAYTAACYGCSGITASGQRAGHGIVAVDPSIIPLGTRLFIPGYGRAIAGDTGGAIVGHRIDLGFDDNGDALRFGRRPITVYVLNK